MNISRIFIVIGLATLIAPANLPDWMIAMGGAMFGGAVVYLLVKKGL